MARARVAWNTNDTDGAAGDANRNVDILNIDGQQSQNLADCRVRRLANAVAALDWPSRAVRGGRRGTSATGGDSNGSSSKSQSGQELELHAEECLGW